MSQQKDVLKIHVRKEKKTRVSHAINNSRIWKKKVERKRESVFFANPISSTRKASLCPFLLFSFSLFLSFKNKKFPFE